MKKMLALSVLLVFAGAVTGNLLTAQDNFNESDIGIGFSPLVFGDASIPYNIGSSKLLDGNETVEDTYKINIYKSVNADWTIFHEPLLMFVPTAEDKVLEGYPSVVHEATPDVNGNTTLLFRVQLTSDPVKTDCLEKFKGEDNKNTLASWAGVQPGDTEGLQKNMKNIRAQVWPIRTALITCQLWDGTPLAYRPIPALQNRRDSTIPVLLKFTPDTLQMFKENAAKDRIEFKVVYTYIGNQTQTSKMNLTGTLSIDSEMLNDLNSAQRAGSEDIFQEYVNKAATKIAARIERRIYAENEHMAGQLLADPSVALVIDRVFSRSEWDGEKLTPREQDVLANYLEPHIRAWEESQGVTENETVSSGEATTNTDTQSKIKRVENTTSTSVGGSAGYGPVAFSLDNTKTKTQAEEESDVQQVVDSLNNAMEKSKGITWARTGNGTEFAPHKISVYRRNTATSELSFTDFSVITIAGESQITRLAMSAVPLSLTVDNIYKQTLAFDPNSHIGRTSLPPVQTTMPGMLVPWFGTDDTVPVGYVIPDGRESTNGEPNVFPYANWVPEGWKGKQIPDLTGGFVAITKDMNEVGKTPTQAFHEDGSYTATVTAAIKPETLVIDKFQIGKKPTAMYPILKNGANPAPGEFNWGHINYLTTFVTTPYASHNDGLMLEMRSFSGTKEDAFRARILRTEARIQIDNQKINQIMDGYQKGEYPADLYVVWGDDSGRSGRYLAKGAALVAFQRLVREDIASKQPGLSMRDISNEAKHIFDHERHIANSTVNIFAKPEETRQHSGEFRDYRLQNRSVEALTELRNGMNNEELPLMLENATITPPPTVKIRWIMRIR